MDDEQKQRVAAIKEALRRGSSLMLDNLGICVNVNEAVDRYAHFLDKSPLMLTDQERIDAIFWFLDLSPG